MGPNMVTENHPKVKRRSLGEVVVRRSSSVVLGPEGSSESKVDFESAFSARSEGDFSEGPVGSAGEEASESGWGGVSLSKCFTTTNNFVRGHLLPTRDESGRRRSGQGEDEGWGQTW